ncbi:hypothetical protein [Methylobacterium sp. 285MFTsu5.1]|uniref:hypothetical protein n=1 Tax=Methylobacterium sp. 285MFTsu5.1 TaxID=1172187 RepID=UPI000369AA2E|nr:hypothetical protein [Methylobacterium sp. 285MFTsu5.1]
MPHPATAPKRRLIPYAGWEPPPVRKPRPKLAVVESTRPAIEDAKRSKSRRGPNIKPEVKAEMRRLEVEEGLLRQDIARRLGICQSTVSKTLGKLPADHVPRNRKATIEDPAWMVRARAIAAENPKLTHAEIGKMVGRHRSTVQKALDPGKHRQAVLRARERRGTAGRG